MYKKNRALVIILCVVIGLAAIITMGYYFSRPTSAPQAPVAQVGATVTSTSSDAAWQEYNASVGSFKVLFPTTPTDVHQELSMTGASVPAKQDVYQSKTSDGTIYGVTFLAYPPEVDISDPATFLENSISAEAVGLSGIVASSGFTYFEGNDAIDFLITVAGAPSEKGITFFVGQDFYQLFVVYTPGDYNDADYNKFLNSFALVGT